MNFSYLTNFTNLIGIIAGIGTTFSFAPQVLHVFRTNDVKGLSPYMLFIHTTGISSWIWYGFLRDDRIIISFNLITLIFLAMIIVRLLYKKIKPSSIEFEETQNIIEC